ncbi:MAG: hypothetical protein ABI378_04890 [Chitinophagaceae bacterium]
MTTTKNELETHPYQPFIPKNATKLIIGSIPPQRFCVLKNGEKVLETKDVDFYYGSKDNSFWRLVGAVFNISLEEANTNTAVEQRKQVLAENGMGITDIVASCQRKEDNSSDENLDIIERKDLRKLLSDNPQIDTLIYTSDFIKKQVNVYFKTYHSTIPTAKKEFTLKIDTKIYKVKILFSPSPNALRNMGQGGSERRQQQYREFLA